MRKMNFTKIYPYLYILPAIVFIALFILYPVAQGLYLSMLDYDPIMRISPYVGMKHYARVFRDPVFLTAVRNNFLYIGVSLITEVAAGLMIALLINKVKDSLISPSYQVIVFTPNVISMVAVGLLFSTIYHPQLGALNTILEKVGLSSWTRIWLGDPVLALGCIIVASSWRYIGFVAVIYFGALQRIPKELYEVASLDGANSIHQFLYITLPLLRGITTVIVGLALIGGFTVFAIPYVITRGQPYHSTEFIVTWSIKRAFSMENISYGTAISVVLLGIVLIATALYLKWREKEVYEY